MLNAENEKEELLRAISNNLTRRILFAISHHPKSVAEIAKETEIPISTCYRAVRMLQSCGLLKRYGIIISPTGKRHIVYLSMIKSVKVNISHDETLVEVSPVLGQAIPN